MNVLIVGGGAREHALTWKALQSPLTHTVYCAPGNAATAAIAVNTGLQATDVDAIARFVSERDVSLTVIGPDAAVAAGLADRLTASGRLVFGPTAAAGRIESSKAFAKALMTRAGVATPAYQVFDDAARAKDFVRGERRAFVVKADGLAKGKGTLVPRDAEETLECIDTLMLGKSVGAAADRIVLEEKIDGREVSLMALIDGERVVPLPPACDYKRALDGDKGPNTGGMGGYSPVGSFGPGEVDRAVAEVLAPGEPERARKVDREKNGVPIDTTTWQQLIEVARNGKGPREPTLTINNVLGIMRACQRGIGVALLPDYLVEENGGLVQLFGESDSIALDAFFVYPEELKSVARVQVFRDFLVAKAQRWHF